MPGDTLQGGPRSSRRLTVVPVPCTVGAILTTQPASWPPGRFLKGERRTAEAWDARNRGERMRDSVTLVVDDSPIAVRILERTLEKMGHQVLVARDGEEAWDVFRENQDIRIVVTDWMMPRCDGMELCRRIRATADRGYVYVLVQTAKTQKSDMVEALEAGADDFISKPIDLEELRARLRVGQRVIELEGSLADRLSEVSEANDQMKRDLEAAAKVQRALLPVEAPDISRLRSAWVYEPCAMVAGDILNVFQLDEKTVGLYVLDVSGHGVQAAMLAVSLSRILSPLPDEGNLLKQRIENPPHYEVASPVAVAQELNRRFPIDPQTYQYFTLLYGVLDLPTLRFRYVQAGHPGPILLRPGKPPQHCGDGDLPIGFSTSVVYTEKELLLEPADRLLVYSDGLLEARGKENEPYGTSRLDLQLAALADGSLEDLLRGLSIDLRKWVGARDLDDDMTVLGIETLP
jgi:sigma-B regulation protein RsbU (phosphoserine phosphatase)